MTGVYGKLPGHGDFVQRDLPPSFVGPWDGWLQTVMAAASGSLGQERFAALWDVAPCWRFHLRPGVCGTDAVAGVLLASRDAAGRRFPLTLASILGPQSAAPSQAWYVDVERAGRAGLDGDGGVDKVLAALPGDPTASGDVASAASAPSCWSREGRSWELPALPTELQLQSMLLADSGRQGGGRWTASAASHPGTVRIRNEDAFVDRSDIGVWAVADGAGGHEAGDVASAAVVAALASIPAGLSAAELLAQVRVQLAKAHSELQRRASSHASGTPGPAATVVVLMVQEDHFACLWAGDSRAYLLREGVMCQVTRDHSLVQEMVDAGLLAAEDAEGHAQANVITRAVGAPDELVLDKISGVLLPGDVLLLCTDGLYKALSDAEIAVQLHDVNQGSEKLLKCALEARARDNVTAIIISREDARNERQR